MRTLVLIGTAITAIVLTDPAFADHDSTAQRVVVRQVTQQVPGDGRVYVNHDDRMLTEADYRQRWAGEWDGQWTPDGSQYHGTYQGTYTPDHPRQVVGYDDDGGAYGNEYAYGYDDSNDYRDYRDERWDHRAMQRRCGRPATAGGIVAGSLIGGIAGNRIAGSGNRTEGTIIGGVLGAAAGAAIGSAADRRRCERWWDSRGYRYQRGSGHHDRYAQHYGYAYAPQGYYYAYPAYAYAYAQPAVTTIIVQGGGQQVTTETVTTTEYETVYEQPAPRVRPARAAPAPVRQRPATRRPTKTKRVYRNR